MFREVGFNKYFKDAMKEEGRVASGLNPTKPEARGGMNLLLAMITDTVIIEA